MYLNICVDCSICPCIIIEESFKLNGLIKTALTIQLVFLKFYIDEPGKIRLVTDAWKICTFQVFKMML